MRARIWPDTRVGPHVYRNISLLRESFRASLDRAQVNDPGQIGMLVADVDFETALSSEGLPTVCADILVLFLIASCYGSSFLISAAHLTILAGGKLLFRRCLQSIAFLMS